MPAPQASSCALTYGVAHAMLLLPPGPRCARLPPLRGLPFFFFNDPATPEFYPLPLPDAFPTPLVAAGEAPEKIAARFPAYSAAWASLAERAFAQGDPVTAYAFARTGYHRGLDQLRRAGWKGRSEEHTFELPSPLQLVCRLLP